jgi:hypothetical protein
MYGLILSSLRFAVIKHLQSTFIPPKNPYFPNMYHPRTLFFSISARINAHTHIKGIKRCHYGFVHRKRESEKETRGVVARSFFAAT